MAIALRCPGCGKHYQLPGKLAGKQVKCKCGRTTQVPVPAKNTPQTPDDIRLIEEPAQAAAVPAPAKPVPNAAAAPASGETLGPVPEETSPPAPKQTLFRRLKAKWLERVPMRTLVGVLSVGYGSLLAALALRPIIMAPLWASWLVALVNLVAIALPALMAVGGVLILRRHEHGPICAGLAAWLCVSWGCWV